MSNDELTPEAAARLARLARLAVPPEELSRLATEVGKIIAYARALQGVDTEGVEPTAHVLLDRLPLRDDEAVPGLDRGEVLAQAPRHDEEGFRVPTFVEE